MFLTITTNNRKPILIDNIDFLRLAFENTKKIYSFEICASVILPDHLHVILKPEDIEQYPKIIFAIKYHFSRNIDEGGLGNPPYALNQSKINKKEKGIWQRRYFEHTIIDEDDLNKHIDYIHYNPVKHELVKCVKDWEYSSFGKFVESGNYDTNWGSSQDVEKVKELNYE